MRRRREARRRVIEAAAVGGVGRGGGQGGEGAVARRGAREPLGHGPSESLPPPPKRGADLRGGPTLSPPLTQTPTIELAGKQGDRWEFQGGEGMRGKAAG